MIGSDAESGIRRLADLPIDRVGGSSCWQCGGAGQTFPGVLLVKTAVPSKSLN